MKLSKSFTHLLALSAVAVTVNTTNPLHAVVEPSAVELLSGTSSLGAAVLSPRSQEDNVLLYDGSSDATPVVVYPVNVSATITAETNPTVSTKRGVTNYSTRFSTYRVTNTTLLGLIDGATLSSRLVYVEAYNEEAGMWLAYNIDGNNGLFVCSTSNLATGNLTAVNPEQVTINLAGSYPLSRTNYSFLTSNESTVSDQTVGNIGVLFSADGYSASGVGSFTSTWAKGLKFSANLTNQEAYRLSGTSASFTSLNDFSVYANGDFVNTASYTYNATNVTFNAGNFFTSDFSENIASVVYSLASNGGLTGATINSTTGVITFNATTAGTYNPVVTATAYFNGRPTPVTGSTGSDDFATIALTVNPAVPVVSVVTPALGLNFGASSPAGFITATNTPTEWSFVSGNPTPGFTFNTANMSAPVIESTGVAAGAYTTTIQASNAGGNSTVQYLTITVNPAD